MTHLFIFGPDSSPDSGLEGNGPLRYEAESLDDALRMFVTEMMVPGEVTGRHRFYEGVSLPLPDHDVVQVWSDSPAATNVMIGDRMSRDRRDSVGLLCEIRFDDIVAVAASNRLNETVTEGAISPIGRNLQAFSDARLTLRMNVQQVAYTSLVRSRAYDTARDELKERMEAMQTQLDLFNAYTSGIRDVVTIHNGDRAQPSMPYSVFQNRQFLDQEIAALACYRDFGFESIELLDKWLVESGELWNFLPFDKTILATRIRKHAKNYGNQDVWRNLRLNDFNFENIVWVRDGRRVVRISVGFDFDNAVFPSKRANDEALKFVLDYIWNHDFKTYSADKEKGPNSVLEDDPAESENPYRFAYVTPHRFDSVEGWATSEEYQRMEPHIKEAVDRHMREVNQKQMKLLLLLQGVTDRTKILSIPAGTDLFNVDNSDRWFTLVYDMNALSFPDYRQAFSPYYSKGAKAGDWIVTSMPSTEFPGRRYDDYGRVRHGRGLTLYRVVRMAGDAPVIMHHHFSAKYPHTPKKTPEPVTVMGGYLRITVPDEVVDNVLKDREWKIANKWIVPLLARWRTVKEKFFKNPVNYTPLMVEVDCDE